MRPLACVEHRPGATVSTLCYHPTTRDSAYVALSTRHFLGSGASSALSIGLLGFSDWTPPHGSPVILYLEQRVNWLRVARRD